MPEIKTLDDVINLFVYGIRVGQSKGAYSLEDAAQFAKAFEWLAKKQQEAAAAQQAAQPPAQA
jgi:hypothetical protein